MEWRKRKRAAQNEGSYSELSFNMTIYYAPTSVCVCVGGL